VGRSNTMEEIEKASEQIINQVKRLRNEKG